MAGYTVILAPQELEPDKAFLRAARVVSRLFAESGKGVPAAAVASKLGLGRRAASGRLRFAARAGYLRCVGSGAGARWFPVDAGNVESPTPVYRQAADAVGRLENGEPVTVRQVAAELGWAAGRAGAAVHNAGKRGLIVAVGWGPGAGWRTAKAPSRRKRKSVH